MFKKVIFPVDLQDIGAIAPYLREVENLIRHTGAELRIISVLPGYSMPIVSTFFPPDMLAKAKRQAEQTLADFVAQQVDASLTVSHVIRIGHPHEEIQQEAMDSGADLIAIPSQVSSGLKILLGSVAQRVAERAACSVLILRHGGETPT